MGRNIIQINNVSKSFAEQSVLNTINLSIEQGEFLTLLGPSGCGKTTLLRMISGFEVPSEGEIYINGINMENVPPQQRQVNTVFQSYALFPHMTVFENVAFGLKCAQIHKEEITERVMSALSMVKLDNFARRKPAQLSGGQQQRVAIARAVVNKPLVLLLDEPLSSLDYRLRKNMQLELKQLQRELNIAFVFVTHDQEEALMLSDRVVVLDEGCIEQIGTPREVYESPVNLTVAKFIGEVNIFDTEIIAIKDDRLIVNIENSEHHYLNSDNYKVGQRIHIVLRPEDINVWGLKEIDETTGMFSGMVTEVIYKGTTVDLMVQLESGKVISATEFFDEDDENLEYTMGENVWVEWQAGWEVILPYEV